MKCPYCANSVNKVIDSRLSKDGSAIRRRRECLTCGQRFTTYEFIEEILPQIVKKDGRREPFDRTKIRAGIKKACEKRPISTEQIERIVDNIERMCRELQEKEIPSSTIGEMVMKELHDLDGGAYVRFASVYRQFRDVTDFLEELKDFLKKGKKTTVEKDDHSN